MNTKRWISASIAVFIAGFILEFLAHQVLLKGQYEPYKTLFRPEEQMTSVFIWVLLGAILVSFLFCFIFAKGYEARGLGEGVRYGIYVSLFVVIPQSLFQYAIYPFPGKLAFFWIIIGTIEMIIYGIIASLIYKKPVQAA